MSHPLVSVIIPTYKRTGYLELTLRSILNQTFKDFEIIVVDDGTPTDCNKVLCEKFNKVKYIKIKNNGFSAKARNVGIRVAKGKYFAFVDDDDLWLPTKLEKQVAVLENNLDFGLVHSCCEVIDENGVKKDEIIGRPGSFDVKHGDISMKMAGSWTIMMPTPLLRRKVIDEVGFFNEKMPLVGEDIEYWTRCSFATNFFYINEPLAQYRVHLENLSSRKENYRKLPFHLKEVLVQQKINKRISNSQYDFLISKMCINQINYIRDHYKLTFQILFELDYFWIFKIQNFKCLIYNVFFRK